MLLQNINMMCTSRWRQDKDTWPSEDAALINDQMLVSEDACGVCIVLDHIISHTNIDVHTACMCCVYCACMCCVYCAGSYYVTYYTLLSIAPDLASGSHATKAILPLHL